MTADEILAIYTGRGGEAYFGEPVTLSEHSLQAAHFAQSCDASDGLIVAALLHDIGHLIEPAPDNFADWKVDAGHERIGSRWLSSYFGPGVYEPVRLHVPAKRYLCATDPEYLKELSPASVVTLGLQGGSMSHSEIEAFEKEPYFRDAVVLRRWDDQAKIATFPTPDFAHYRPLMEKLATRQAAAGAAATERERPLK